MILAVCNALKRGDTKTSLTWESLGFYLCFMHCSIPYFERGESTYFGENNTESRKTLSSYAYGYYRCVLMLKNYI